YSAEEGTPSPAYKDQVAPETAAERAPIVQAQQDRLAGERNAALAGTVVDVLIDGPSEDPAFAWEGRTAGQAPEIDGVVYLRDPSLTPGRFARIRIVEVEGYELVGERSSLSERGGGLRGARRRDRVRGGVLTVGARNGRQRPGAVHYLDRSVLASGIAGLLRGRHLRRHVGGSPRRAAAPRDGSRYTRRI